MARSVVALLMILCLSVAGADNEAASSANSAQRGFAAFPMWLKVSLGLAALISFFTDRYQAITYEISKASSISSEIGVGYVQMYLTPSWVGILGWLQYPTLLAVLIIFWLYYAWWIGLLASVVWLLGFGLAGHVLPIPPQSTMVKMMLAELKKQKDNRYKTGSLTHWFEIIEADLKDYRRDGRLAHARAHHVAKIDRATLMDNKSTLKSLALEAHESLNEYVDFHDEVHKAQSSFMSVIKRTFGKSIPFDEFYKNSCALEVAWLGLLEKVKSTQFESSLSSDEEAFYSILIDYIGRVQEAVTKLKERQEFLLEMANGAGHSFTQLSDFESSYQVAVQAYVDAGHKLKRQYEMLL